MAVYQQIKLQELCRLCLKGPGWVDIHQTHLLPQNIYSCTGIKVSVVDKLPSKICKNCFEIVNSANRLRILATKNDIHLTELKKSNFFSELDNYHEKKEDKKSSEIFCINNETLDQNQSNCCVNAVFNEEFEQPKIIKVRTDLFRNPPNKERHEEENGFRRDSVDVVQDKKCDKSLEIKCDTCSKFFETRKKLYLHKRLHNKTHLCKVEHCEKKFATKGDLEKHVRTHTGEKPFICNFCERGFAQSGTLKIHMESIHGMCKVEVQEEYTIV